MRFDNQQIRKQLSFIRMNVNVEDNSVILLKQAIVSRDRHLQTRVLLARSHAMFGAQKSHAIAEAADILLAFLGKTQTAHMLYQYAAQSELLTDATINLNPVGLDKSKQYEQEIISEEALRAQLLSLRERERFDEMASLLQSIIHKVGVQNSREWQLELGSVLRFDCRRAEEAADVYESMVEQDCADREAWAELFECLEFLEDEDRLRIAVNKRILLSQGLEKRELMRQYGWLIDVEKQNGFFTH